MIVVDASAVVEVLLNTPLGGKVASMILTEDETLHAPYLLDIEVMHALRRCALAGKLEKPLGEECVEDYLDLPIERYSHHPLLPRIWELRGNFTAYDATYLALAEALGAPLLTCDAAFASARPHRARVVLV